MKKRLPLALAATFALAACDVQNNPSPVAKQAQTALTAAPVVGKNCIGLVEIEIAQSSFTLDPIEHWKNRANASRLTVGFLPSEYNQFKEGRALQSDFRSGSFWLNGGKISSREITVIKKHGFACE